MPCRQGKSLTYQNPMSAECQTRSTHQSLERGSGGTISNSPSAPSVTAIPAATNASSCASSTLVLEAPVMATSATLGMATRGVSPVGQGRDHTGPEWIRRQGRRPVAADVRPTRVSRFARGLSAHSARPLTCVHRRCLRTAEPVRVPSGRRIQLVGKRRAIVRSGVLGARVCVARDRNRISREMRARPTRAAESTGSIRDKRMAADRGCRGAA